MNFAHVFDLMLLFNAKKRISFKSKDLVRKLNLFRAYMKGYGSIGCIDSVTLGL